MSEGNLPKRKHPRLKGYDYSRNGSYAITICTKHKECILGKIVYDYQNIDNIKICLSQYGKISEKHIQRINNIYDCIRVDNYVIMPNHIHLLITIERPLETAEEKIKTNVDICTVVRAFKRMVARDTGESIWQDSFYDTVIDTDDAYYNEYEYINNNPVLWVADKYFRT